MSYLKLIEADAYRPSARITAILAATLGCDIDDITGPLDDQAAA